MNEMLAGVISHGTGKAAALPRPAAGKTGTTQEYRDAWFIGYTADLVAGVWLGNDDNTRDGKGDRRVAAGAGVEGFMLTATQGMPIRPLPGGAPQQTAVVQPAATAPTPPGNFFGLLAPPTTAAATTTTIPLAPGTVVPAPRN